MTARILRRLLFFAHSWLGLSAGALLAVSAASGSALVFSSDLDRQLHPDLLRVSPTGDRVPIAAVVAAAAAHGGAPRRIRMPTGDEAAVEVWMDDRGQRTVYVDPYTGRVLGSRLAASSPIGFLRALHTGLFAGETGELLVALLGAVLAVLCLSGAVLWWPRKGNLRRALALRRPLRWRQTNYDLHKLLGACALAFLLVAALTGIGLAFLAPLKRAAYWVSGADLGPAPRSRPTGTAPPLSLAELLAAADRVLPEAKTTWIYLPAAAHDPFTVRKRFAEEVHPSGMSFVHLDRYSGALLGADRARDAPWAARLCHVLYPLHTGALGGSLTQWLAVALGAVPGALFVTGFFFWRARERKSES